MAAKFAAGVAAAAVVTAVATGERWNWTIAAVAAVPCPVTPLLRCDPRMGATTVSSMDGHIWRWAGNIPPGFEPEFEPRLAHYSKCYTYTWFLLGFAKRIHIQFGA